MLNQSPFLSAVFFLVLSVYCFLSPIYCLLLSAFYFLSPAYCLLLSDFSTGRNHLEIAIMLGFWYSEVNFRGVIETDLKEFKIGSKTNFVKTGSDRESEGRLNQEG
jgi:hypothetical protein